MILNVIIIVVTEDILQFLFICDRTGYNRLQAVELVLLFVFSCVIEVIHKTQEVTKQVTNLFLCPSVTPLIGWYVDIPSVKQFAYCVLKYCILHTIVTLCFLI